MFAVCGAVLTIVSIIVWLSTRMMLVVVMILAVCGYCSAQCSPAVLAVPPILTHPAQASDASKLY